MDKSDCLIYSNTNSNKLYQNWESVQTVFDTLLYSNSKFHCISCRVVLTPIYPQFMETPKIFALHTGLERLSIKASIHLNINGNLIEMRLGGIIYFGDAHFTCRIVDSINNVYYNDGLMTGNQCIYEGNFNNFTSEQLSRTCNKIACYILYYKA